MPEWFMGRSAKPFMLSSTLTYLSTFIAHVSANATNVEFKVTGMKMQVRILSCAPFLERNNFLIKYIFIVILMMTNAANATIVSWYGPGFHGKNTANGEKFNQWGMTAAHRTLPFGTRVLVTYKRRSVVVRINDRGPFIKGRTLDLSRGAAKRIGCNGVCKVKIKILNK